ncbi:MAG: alpha/beta hydrolase [Thermoanaerobaculales bacterium]|jgi:3-oxoadipate enol-lactonase|nr:alpha/beta hydrolase [Thermoanaerobaculales bacterium]
MPRERIGDVELYYELSGSGDEVFAFVNGVAMTVQSWAPIRELVEGGFRCLLHDTRGQLMSEKPAADYTMEMHAGDLANLLDHVGIERVHLAGTSYGAEIAMIFAAEHQERVETLHVITGVSELDGVLRAATESWAVGAKHGIGPLFRSMIPWTYSSGYLEENAALLDDREKLLGQLPEDYLEGFVRLVRAFHGLDISDRLGSISCPTLVIAAENDLVKPLRFSERIHERIPDSELVVIPDSGHAVVVEDPESVARHMLDFIARRSRS